LQNTHTAILLFSKFSCQKQANEKVFLRNVNSQTNQQIASSLFEYTFELVQKTHLPFFWIGAKEQVGETFGERISHATLQVFQKGYENVIIIGDDCPSLSLSDFKKATQAFTKHRPSIGFAEDGGAYLIGISKQHFQKNNFASLAWQKSNLGEGLIAYFDDFGTEVSLLSTKSDIDNYVDWVEIIHALPHQHSFKRTIQHLFSISSSPEIIYFYIYQLIFYFSIKSLRAPPH
jgi:glycosyltransferase A (GT-A) superfamily protein (DUF2064 family)